MTVVVFLALLFSIGPMAAAAQTQMPQMQMGRQAGQQGQPPEQQPQTGYEMMGPGMMGMPMHGMPCPMMGGGTGMMMPGMRRGQMGMPGMGMVGMMGSGQMDPKVMGRMLQLRGDILKAVGEVLIKHGKALEQSK